MIDIDAIRRVAEALQKSGLLTDRFDYITALSDPATVLELCRLAEIGKATEDGFNSLMESNHTKEAKL